MINPFNKYDTQIEFVSNFKLLLRGYYYSRESDRRIDLREKLNLLNAEILNCVEEVGLSSYVCISPEKPFIELFHNIFILDRHNIEPELVFDILDRTIGKYNLMQKQLTSKLLNPICWVAESIRIPFYLASFAGFDANKIEISWVGKIWKFILSIAAFLAALAGILTFLKVSYSQVYSYVVGK